MVNDDRRQATRVYVAGNYSKNNVGEEAGILDIIDNIKVGIETCAYLLSRGFSVYCPWLDFQYGLHYTITERQYRENSMAWLTVSDAVLVISGRGLGTGVDKEIKRAEALGIPVYYDDVLLFADRRDGKI